MVNGNIKILLQGHIPVTSLLTHLRLKQPSRGVLRECCSKNMEPIYTPMLKYDFNKVTKQLY